VVYTLSLRCAGSDGYLAWVDSYVCRSGNYRQPYPLQIFRLTFRCLTTSDSHKAIEETKNTKQHALWLVTAGHAEQEGSRLWTVIGDYERQWNLDQTAAFDRGTELCGTGRLHATRQGLEVDGELTIGARPDHWRHAGGSASEPDMTRP